MTVLADHLNPARMVLADHLNPARTVLADHLNPARTVLADHLNPARTVLADHLNPARTVLADHQKPARTTPPPALTAASAANAAVTIKSPTPGYSTPAGNPQAGPSYDRRKQPNTNL